MSYFIKLLVIVALITLQGCAHLYGDKGLVKNRDTDYLKAKSIPPLKIPPGYSSSSIESNYPVSERVYPPQTKSVDLTPPEL